MIFLYITIACLTACLAILTGIMKFVYQPLVKELTQKVEELSEMGKVHETMLEDITSFKIRDDIYVKLATLNNEIQRIKRQ